MSDKKTIGLSALVAIERQVDAIASNIANSGTVGYRSAGIQFHEYITKIDDTPRGAPRTSSLVTSNTYVSQIAGAPKITGSSTDVAIVGDGFFQLRSSSGPILTRNGAFRLDGAGTLVSLDGLPVETTAGVVRLPSASAEIRIQNDGSIWSGGERLGALKVVRTHGKLSREASQMFSTDGEIVPLRSVEVRVVPGALESSNVHAEAELVRMLEAKRAYQLVATALLKDNDTDELRKLSGQAP